MAMQSPDRQRLILDTFVGLVDTLASDYDVNELLQFLVDRTQAILDADTVGVLLETEHGELRLAAATSQEMDAIEEAEINSGEGPCMDAYRTREPVIVSDLEDCRDRWPHVVPRLLDMGMRSGHAFPLKLRDDCIGALNIYRRSPGRFDDDALRIGQAFADAVAVGILQQRKISEAQERSQHLRHALQSRVIIEQAKGMVAERAGIGPDEAFQVLRSYARNSRIRLHDLSHQVVAGTAPDLS